MMRTPRGYTLLELIVSIGLFSIVMLVVTSAYLALISMDREARATNELVANLSFATESMMRNIRTGTSYSCGSGNGNCTQFTFLDSQGQPMTYRLKSNNTIGQCSSGTCVDASAIPLTDTRITIQSLTFYVRGVGTSDVQQPQVTVTIKGTMATDAGKTTSFNIESSATQRLIEL